MNHLECITPKRNKWYWYLLVLFLGYCVANTIGSIPLFLIIGLIYVRGGDVAAIAAISKGDFVSAGIDKNVGFFAMMFVFFVFLIALAFIIKYVHEKGWKQVINGTNTVRWSRVLTGFVVWGVLQIIVSGISYIIDSKGVTFQFKPIQFIVLCLLSFIFIPFQATFEEFSFRGYLAQGIGSWTKSRLCAWLIPAVLFGLMHSANPEIAEYGYGIMISQYIFMGLLFGLISILDDGIELTMGLHSANNMFACLFFTYDGSALQTDALFNVHDLDPVGGFFELLVCGIIVVVFFAFKYKWDFKVLTAKIGLICQNSHDTSDSYNS